MADLPTPEPDEPSVDGSDHELTVVRRQIAESLFPGSNIVPLQRIGRFVVEKRLGAGAMGIVYAARDPALARCVAIKLVRPDAGGDRRAQRRLQREARALAKVSHPNIVAIHEVGEHREQVFLAMELVDGQTLRAWQEQEPRSVDEVLAVYVQAGRGLAAAHAAGLVHRDFKPDNVLLDEDGRARVVDFGLVGHDEQGRRAELARWGGSTVLSSTVVVTQTHALVGTPAYMSPEQLDGGTVDARSDQFGFCEALYEALYGEHPFDATSLASLRRSVLHGRLRERPRRSRVPAWIHRLLVRGLAVAPADRHPSLDALLDALSRDPVASRRRWLAVGGLLIAASAGTYALARQGVGPFEPRCDAVTDELARTWNPERRAAIGQAMAATGLAHAASTWVHVEAELDAYAAEWSAARTEACRARGGAHEPARQHDLRVACLERGRAALEGLVAALEQPTATDVENAARALAGLPELGACADVEARAVAIPPPEDPQVAAAVAAHRQALARAHQHELLGRHDEGRRGVVAVLASTEAESYLPLAAEASLALGSIELAASRFEEAAAALSRALEAGMRVDHFAVAAEAFARRLLVYGKLGRGKDAVRELPLARALVERTGDDRLRWWLHHGAGTSHHALGRCAEAKQSHLDALASISRVQAEEGFDHAVTLDALSQAESCLGDEAAARAAAARAVAARDRARGMVDGP